MNTLTVNAADGVRHFRPGDALQGYAAWELEEAPKSVEIRLFWYTEGKGDQDVAVADTVYVEGATQYGQCDFAFTLPAAPYSFSGKLITLKWAIELVIQPHTLSERFDFFLSPSGREVDLYVLGLGAQD